MSFGALMTAIALYYFWGAEGPLHNPRPIAAWQAWVSERFTQSWQVLLVTVLAPVLVAFWLLSAFDGILFGLPQFGISVALLLYAFGWWDFHTALNRYAAQCERGDAQGAWMTLSAALSSPPVSEPADANEAHSFAFRALLLEGYQRWFPVVFYGVLLGPVAAFGYRLVLQSTTSSTAAGDSRVVYILDFVPARLLAASFALAGDLMRCRSALQRAITDSSLAADKLLQSVAEPALGGPVPVEEVALSAPAHPQNAGDLGAIELLPSVQDMQSLLRRCAALWVVVVSLLVIVA